MLHSVIQRAGVRRSIECMHGPCKIGVNFCKPSIVDPDAMLVEEVLECKSGCSEAVEQRNEGNGPPAGPGRVWRAAGRSEEPGWGCEVA